MAYAEGNVCLFADAVAGFATWHHDENPQSVEELDTLMIAEGASVFGGDNNV
jgi:hypothetical protein